MCGMPKSGEIIPTIRIRRPGRVDLGVELDDQVRALLATDAPVAIGVSGGKDSCAAAIAVCEHLDAIGHAGPRILIHSDLGRVEWRDSLSTCQRLAKHLGVELVVVRRGAGDMMDRWMARWRSSKQRYAELRCMKLILPWSTPAMRFCTSEMKSAVIASWLVRRFPGKTIVSAAGIRRQESDRRSCADTTKTNVRLARKSRGTSGVDWNPIAHWSEDDVFAFAADRAFSLHEGYGRYGMRRISCVNCIMADEADLRSSSKCSDNHAVTREMVELEVTSTFAFQGSRWLGDVQDPAILGEDLCARLAKAKERARRRQAVESRIPRHLLYTKGWPTVMPTRAEAEAIAEIRREIAAIVDIEVGYTNADTILARFAELMAENERRGAAKATKTARRAARVR